MGGRYPAELRAGGADRAAEGILPAVLEAEAIRWRVVSVG
jgi:hypothetical protein